MRIAIFSDVHGNLTALEAVLAHIDRQTPDIIAFAGDICLFGPRPAACIELVSQRGIISVYGNTDVWILDPPIPPDDIDEKHRPHRQHLYDISNWTQALLSDTDRAWLKALPFDHRISPTSDPADDLLIVHANPQDVNQVIFPSNSDQRAIFGEVKQEQSDEALAPLLQGVQASVLAFGHLHVPNIRPWPMGDLTLANISSVSLPGDGDSRAKYGLLTWDKEAGWTIEHQYVSYDIPAEQGALAAARPPNWESYVRRLEGSGD